MPCLTTGAVQCDTVKGDLPLFCLRLQLSLLLSWP